MNVAEVIVATLEEAGVRHCYGVVGDTLNHITDAIRRSSIEWVHMRHEEAGAMAAGGEAYMTGRLTACAGTCGPGSLHVINGLFEAHRNRSPVIMIATQVATSQMGMDFPQEVDLKPIFQTCSHFCEYVHNPEQARRVTVLAAQAALNNSGAAVIIVPGDFTPVKVKDALHFRVHKPAPVTRPSDEELDQIAAALNASERLAVYCGAGCQSAEQQILALANHLQVPVAHTSRAKDFIEPNNPFNVGMTGILGVASGFHTLNDCDTLLLLGADFAWAQYYPNAAKLIQIDRIATHLGRRHPVDIGVVGNVRDTLDALMPRLKKVESRAFLQKALGHHDKTVAALKAEERASEDGVIHPQYLTQRISELAAEDAIFTADGGGPMVWLLRHIKSTGKRRTLTSLVHGTMANAMPESLGIKKALPDRQVISLSGDGGIAMLLGDLLTAIQENIAIKVVVFNNGTLGFVELEQKVEGLLDAYTDLKNPDFGRLAEVIGFWGRTVSKAGELDDAIKEFLDEKRPALLNVMTNRFELVMPPNVTVDNVLHTALYSTKAVLTGRGEDVVKLLKTNFLE